MLPPIFQTVKATVLDRLAYLASLILVVVMFVLLWADVGHAQSQNCGPTSLNYEAWNEEFGEFRLVAIYKAGPDGPFAYEIFMNPETEIWTIFITTPDGQSCLVDDGGGVLFSQRPYKDVPMLQPPNL